MSSTTKVTSSATTSSATSTSTSTSNLALSHGGSSYNALMLGVSFMETGLGFVMFICWTFSAWKFTKRFRIDYWVGLVTLLVGCLAQAFLAMRVELATNFGDPAAFANMSPADITITISQSMEYGWLAEFIGLVATALGKLCIVIFLIQSVGHTHPIRPWVLSFLGALNFSAAIVTIVLFLTACEPAGKLWNPQKRGSCNKEAALDFAFFAGSLSACTDMFLATYPIPVIMTLHMAMRIRVGICVLMGFGTIAAICAAIKTSKLRHLTTSATDTSYNDAPLVLTTISEQWITLIVACVPPSAPVLRSLFKSARKATTRSSTTGGPDHTGLYLTTRKRTAKDGSPSFVTRPNHAFRSLAYASQETKGNSEIYELQTDSSDSIVAKDRKGITLTTKVDVEVQYDLPHTNFKIGRAHV